MSEGAGALDPSSRNSHEVPGAEPGKFWESEIMSCDHPTPITDPESPSQGPPLAGDPAPAPPAAAVSLRRTRAWVAACTAALLAGIGAWLVGEKSAGYYAPSHEADSHPYSFTRLRREKSVADARNTAVAYGALGALLGLGLGAAGGLARRSVPSGWAGAVVGSLLGGAAGAGPCLVIVPLYLRTIDPAQPTLVLPLLSHGVVWTAIGLAAGLAFGLGAGARDRAIAAALGGAVGAMLGTFCFEVLQAVTLPLQRGEEFMGDSAALRLAADLCVAVFAAAGTVALATAPSRKMPVRA